MKKNSYPQICVLCYWPGKCGIYNLFTTSQLRSHHYHRVRKFLDGHTRHWCSRAKASSMAMKRLIKPLGPRPGRLCIGTGRSSWSFSGSVSISTGIDGDYWGTEQIRSLGYGARKEFSDRSPLRLMKVQLLNNDIHGVTFRVILVSWYKLHVSKHHFFYA
jgi:hypothetical protein